MKKIIITISLLLFILSIAVGQRNKIVKYGYLPGIKFPIYKTVNNYDLKGERVRVNILDERNAFKKCECSDALLEKDSEFEGDHGLKLFQEYIETLFANSNLIIDQSSDREVEIRLQAFSPRLIGAGFITVHGYCQITTKYKEYIKTYCTDIKDGDKNSGVGRFTFATRKTAFRQMQSVSVRETIEKMIKNFSVQEN